MGRTVPSFRNVIAEEKHEWKAFRNFLSKSEKKSFDEMWDIPRLYVMASSNTASLVPFHPIVISILFHHYKELREFERQINKLKQGNSNNEINDFAEHLQNQMEIELEAEEEQLTLFDF
ncbi:MAG: hypothetical protein M3261_03475 [Thermoproteota archaeon]|nr:hypothetical protein [Thermoproteota archaeon]